MSFYHQNITRSLCYAALASCLFLTAGCNSPKAPASSGGSAAPTAKATEPVVEINGTTITREEYREILFDRFAVNNLESFIEEKLIAQKAKELGVVVPKADIDAEVEKSVSALLKTRFNGNENAMRRALQERSLTLEGWKGDLARRAEREKLLEGIIKKQRGSEDDAVRQRFTQTYGEDGLKYRVRHILISTKVINSKFYTKENYEKDKLAIEDDLQKRGRALIERIKKGETFNTLAKEHSDDFTRNRGGDLGQSWKGRFGSSFDDAISRLDPGTLSPLIRSRRGYHIAEVTGVVKGVEYKGKAILVSTGPNGPADRRSQDIRDKDAQAKAKEVQAALAKGMPFDEAAKKFSDDTSTKSRGGDLGLFGRRRLGKEVGDLLENAKIGTVTAPIKVPRGYWIIKLENRTFKPKEDRKTVRHILLSAEFDAVKERRLKGRLEELAKTKAESVLDELKKGEKFEDLVLKYTEDSYTSKKGGEYINYRSTSLGPEIWKAIQDMDANSPAKIVKSRRGYHIVDVIEKTVTKFEDVKDKLLAEANSQPVNPSEAKSVLQKIKAKATIKRHIGSPPPPPATPADAKDRLKSSSPLKPHSGHGHDHGHDHGNDPSKPPKTAPKP